MSFWKRIFGGSGDEEGRGEDADELDAEGSDAAPEGSDAAPEASGLAELSREGAAVVAARVAVPAFDETEADADEVLARVLDEHGHSLRSLVIGLWGEVGAHEYDGAISQIASRAGRLPSLTDVFLGDFEFPDETEISWTTIGDVAPLLAAFPTLRRLKLRGGGITLGQMHLEALEELILETGSLPDGAVESLANARLPSLRRMEVWFGDPGYDGPDRIEPFLPFFQGLATPNVSELGLKNCAFADALAAALVDSPLAAQLRWLDLGMGTLTDAGALVLAKGASAFRNLETFELDHSFVGEEGASALRGAFGDRLRLGVTEKPECYDDETHYFVQVGE